MVHAPETLDPPPPSPPARCRTVHCEGAPPPLPLAWLQVVRQNGRQMLVTILFAFMVVYVFAVWAFSISYFRNNYQIIDQAGTFGVGEDGHPHLGPDSGYAP